ncbi:helix-turn-helix domain-containing protein [Leifsonia aquatica]|uniref:helix-turn-helix domain-containing protein n=1 Tax=Leifsonia aquatica TaxID=144185 RepID=UPI00384A968E
MDYTGHPLRDVMPLAEAFGAGLRRIRLENSLTLDRVASASSTFGLKWSTARVVEFENGRIPITLPTLMRLGTALTALTGRGVSLADLLGWDHWLELPGSPGGLIHAEAFRQAFSGGPVDLRQGDELEWASDAAIAPSQVLPGVPEGITTHQLRFGHEYAGLADERAARALGVSLDVFLSYALPVLGTSLTEYRDSRLRRDANAQERGQLTRRATKVVREFAERFESGDPDAVAHLDSYIRGDPGWKPLADGDDYIRSKMVESRRDSTRRMIDRGLFVSFGANELDADRLADERWWIRAELVSEGAYDLHFEELLRKWDLAST